MTSGKDIRDQQSDYRQSVEDRFVESAEQHPDVTKAARRDAEALIKKQAADRFEQAVTAAIEEEKEKARRADQNQEE